MAHLAAAYLKSCWSNPSSVNGIAGFTLTASQAAAARSALLDDARGSIYSGLVSYAEAVHGLDKGLFAWSTVKLYYACFYLAQSFLNRSGKCVFYIGRSPIFIECVAGATPLRKQGNSHSIVRNVYQDIFHNGALAAQPIGGVPAIEWMAQQREQTNYRDLRFSDPSAPAWFHSVEKWGLRRLLATYVHDPVTYQYDEDHAMLALPTAAFLESASSSLGFSGLGLNAQDLAFIRGRLRDSSGPISLQFL